MSVKKSSWISLISYCTFVLGVLFVSTYIVLFLFYQYDATNKTLEHAHGFAQSTPEYPKVENNNWYKPDYRTFFKQQLPSFTQRIIYSLGISKPYWSVASFVSLIKEVSQERSQRGYVGDFVQKIIPSDNTQCVIWGNLQGAFHSFVRDLEALQERSIINSSLHITDPNYYFVFTGNVVSRSPYSLETLLLVLRLMKANPERVIYIKGTHEDHQYWQDFDMRRALRTRLWQQAGRKIPLSDEINAFFDTLPQALFIVGQETDNAIQALVISNELTQEKVKLHELSSFLGKSNQAVIQLLDKKMVQKKDTKKVVHDRVRIISNYYKPNSYLTEGLRMVLPRTEAAIWTVLSSPTSSYQKRFNFENDAFALLHTKGTFSEWTITLCKQNSYTQEGFDCSKVYNLLSGFAADFEHTFTGEIVIGSSLDLSMVIQRFGEYLEEGMQARIRDENEKGGVQGNQIRLVVKDDGYQISRARKNVEEFLKAGIDIILAPLGTEPLEGYINLAREKKIAILFPAAGVHDQSIEYLVYYRPSVFTEGEVITKYALKNLNPYMVGFFYPNDQFGTVAVEGARKVLDASDRTSYKLFPYKRNTLNFTQQVTGMKEYNPGTLAFFCITPPAQEFIRQVGVHNLSNDQLIGLSDLTPDRFRRFLQDNGLKVTVSSVVPNPRIASNSFLKEYQASMKRNRVDLNTNSLEGYIAASLFIHALKKIKGNVTKEKVIAVLESIKNFDMGGIPISFNSQTRSLSDALWIAYLPEGTTKEWERVELKHGDE